MSENEELDKQGSEEQSASESIGEARPDEPTEETVPVEGSNGGADPAMMNSYWRANQRLIFVLLIIWATLSIVMSILLVEPLNKFNVPGGQLPFGFWMAQQGSIYGFVLLIFFYAWRMDKIDRDHDVHD